MNGWVENDLRRALIGQTGDIERIRAYPTIFQPWLRSFVVRTPEGEYWTPNGHHRLAALGKLGARSINALLVPEFDIAFQILALAEHDQRELLPARVALLETRARLLAEHRTSIAAVHSTLLAKQEDPDRTATPMKPQHGFDCLINGKVTSTLDGRRRQLTPEGAIAIQEGLRKRRPGHFSSHAPWRKKSTAAV